MNVRIFCGSFWGQKKRQGSEEKERTKCWLERFSWQSDIFRDRTDNGSSSTLAISILALHNCILNLVAITDRSFAMLPSVFQRRWFYRRIFQGNRQRRKNPVSRVYNEHRDQSSVTFYVSHTCQHKTRATNFARMKIPHILIQRIVFFLITRGWVWFLSVNPNSSDFWAVSCNVIFFIERKKNLIKFWKKLPKKRSSTT